MAEGGGGGAHWPAAGGGAEADQWEKKTDVTRSVGDAMRRNVEVKARLRDAAAVRDAAERLSGTGGRVLQQADCFFRVPRGRLKLRREAVRDREWGREREWGRGWGWG